MDLLFTPCIRDSHDALRFDRVDLCWMCCDGHNKGGLGPLGCCTVSRFLYHCMAWLIDHVNIYCPWSISSDTAP